jgi:hypothetical protein
MMLEFCKWDSQIEDATTLAPFPLILKRSAWLKLSSLAESATAELLEAERELLQRPDLHRELGLPRAIRRALSARLPASPPATRVMRFDFHPTLDGWRISEVNRDVPGGFTESSSFTHLMAEFSDAVPAGCPVTAWADAVARAGESAALIYAPGYLEDMQIMVYLSHRLADRHVAAYLAAPRRLHFVNGAASLESPNGPIPIDVIVRFFQAEWLPRSAPPGRWAPFFVGGRTPLANPATAILTESKRFSLIADELHTPMPTWRKILPETRDPRHVPWRTDESWIVKTAFCNTGDTVCIRGDLTARKWRKVQREIFFRPRNWVAQKRFQILPLHSPAGKIFPCIGVYTIDGQAAGIYGRFAKKPLIDYAAADAAVLVEKE